MKYRRLAGFSADDRADGQLRLLSFRPRRGTPPPAGHSSKLREDPRAPVLGGATNGTRGAVKLSTAEDKAQAFVKVLQVSVFSSLYKPLRLAESR